jgi:Bacterial aa3 type cytochrome c oxidase subunit IV
MADHGTVEYATATGADVAKDLAAHEATYVDFVHFAAAGTLYVINVVLALAIGAVAGHWGVAFLILVVSSFIGLPWSLAASTRTPLVVLTVLSLLALAVTA